MFVVENLNSKLFFDFVGYRFLFDFLVYEVSLVFVVFIFWLYL